MSAIIWIGIHARHHGSIPSSNVPLQTIAMLKYFPDLHIFVRYVKKKASVHNFFHHRINLFCKRFGRDFRHLEFTCWFDRGLVRGYLMEKIRECVRPDLFIGLISLTNATPSPSFISCCSDWSGNEIPWNVDTCS